MLDYSNLDKLTDITDEERDIRKNNFIQSELSMRRKLSNAKVEQINTLTYENNLICLDLIQIIKEDLAHSSLNIFRGFSSTLLKNAYKYFDVTYNDKGAENNMSIDEKESITKAFDYVITYANHFILGDNEEFHCSGMYEMETGLLLGYNYLNQQILIALPDFANVDTKNFFALLDGYAAYVGVPAGDKVSWELISRDLDYTKVAEDIHKWAAEVEILAKAGDDVLPEEESVLPPEEEQPAPIEEDPKPIKKSKGKK